MDARRKRILYAGICGGLAGVMMGLYGAFNSIWAHVLVAAIAGVFVGFALYCIVRCGHGNSR